MRRGLVAVAFLVILFGTGIANAQFLGGPSRPEPSPTMPEWAKWLYVTPINIHRIDSAFLAYQQRHPGEPSTQVAINLHRDEDVETGEAEGDLYANYYKRWRHQVASYLQPDGSLRQASPDELEHLFRPNRTPAPKPSGADSKPTGANSWTPIIMNTCFPGEDTSRPWQANVYAIAVAPSNPNILIAGTEPGAIYKTTDKGLNWFEIGKEYQLQTKAIAIHPTDPNTIYLTAPGAIRKSIDGGTTWTTLLTIANLWGNRIKILPSNPNVILVAASTGLYRSSDAGATWKTLSTTQACELAVHPTNPSLVYAMILDSVGVHYQFWKSNDAGATFIMKQTGWYTDTTSWGGRMTVSLADPNRIYAVLLTTTTAKGPKIMRSNDAGETWSLIATGNTTQLNVNNGQGYYDLSIIASPLNADLLIVGTQTTAHSTDGGVTWVALGGYSGPFPIHPDLQEAEAEGGDTWIATDGGLTQSTDFFTSINNAHARIRGIDGSDFWAFDAGWNKDIMVGGRYHNGNTAYSETYGDRFMRMGGGEAATGYVNPMRPNLAYFSDIGAYVLPDSFTNRFSSIPIGKWPNESYFEMWYSRMTWDPRYYNVVWIGAKNTLWKSVNGGASYDPVFSVRDTNAWIEHIEIARSNPNVMYVTAHSNTSWDSRIWRSINAGASWDTLPVFQGTTGSDRRILTIAVSGTNENEIWAALNTGSTANKVFNSTDGGKHWTNLTTPTIANTYLTDLLHQLGTDGGVYIASGGGQVFYRNHAMTDWQPYSDGLPLAHYTRALKPLYRDNKLRSGSNLGIWEIPLYEISKPLAQPMVDKQSSACPRDTFYFDDYSALRYKSQSWDWSFPGASSVSSTVARNPKVVYPGPGNYSVSLTVTNANGSSTKAIANMVSVVPSECGIDSFANRALDLTVPNSSATISAIPAMAGDTAFTVSAWVKLALVQTSFSQLVSNWSSDVGFSFGFAFEGYARNTNLTFYWKNVPYQLTSPFNLDTNVWTHVAITVQPTKVTLYKDGIPWVYPGVFKPFDLSQTPFVIGSGLPGQGGRFDGQIDELKFYNYALTTQEIRERMHLISPAPEKGLAAYYQFDEASPSLLYDRVGDMHAANSGGARAVSTAPVATGTSARIRVTHSGVQDFTLPNVQVRYGPNDTLPNDDVVAYRLFAQPDSLPNISAITKFTNNYWIIRNWGKAGKGLDTLLLENIGQISSYDSTHEHASFQLFTRTPNEFLNSWQTSSSQPLDQFSKLSRTLAFPMQDSGALYGQFLIGTLGDSPLEVSPIQQQANALTVFPNPTKGIVTLSVPKNSFGHQRVTVYDMLGRKVQEEGILNASAVELDLSKLPSGCYEIHVNDRVAWVVKQ